MNDFDLAAGIGEIVEVFSREPLYHRIDLVKLKVVPRPGVGGQCADP